MIVNLTTSDTEALKGVLWSYRGGWLTLRDVYALSAGNNEVKADGDVVLHRSQVRYYQVLP